MKIKNRKIKDLIPAEYNPRGLTDEEQIALRGSLTRFGIVDPVIVNTHADRSNIIVGGHQRCKVWEMMGNDSIPTVEVELTFEQEKELNIRLNKNTGHFDNEILTELFETSDLIEWGFDEADLVWEDEETPEIGEGAGEVPNLLTDKFIIPPFSILDTRQGYWQDRKRYWKSLINDNGESRETSMNELEELSYGSWKGKLKAAPEVSILDPVLAEIANRWFGIEGGKTFDCFAGDTVFGYVSSYLGNLFQGIELRQEQADLNNERVKEYPSQYICDSGENVLEHIAPDSQDLLFSCPPYFDLEVYSDLPEDASNQGDYQSFIDILDRAFTASIQCLKENRFAFIVVGDVRDKKGFYHRFPDHIKDIFQRGGMNLLNELILIEMAGTLPMRVEKIMKGRKVGKCHQNVLIFYKGDPTKIKDIFPKIDISTGEEDTDGGDNA